jgi:hypothetical protein
MKTTTFLLLFFLCGNIIGQVTDTDIVNSILGKKYYDINSQLDSMGVWYHVHYPERIKENVKVYSIADGDGTVKLFIMKLNMSVVNEVIINYRHDSREQIEDAMKVITQSDIHVGKFSTDLVFKPK